MGSFIVVAGGYSNQGIWVVSVDHVKGYMYMRLMENRKRKTKSLEKEALLLRVRFRNTRLKWGLSLFGAWGYRGCLF
jgi:hypothetical protein